MHNYFVIIVCSVFCPFVCSICTTRICSLRSADILSWTEIEGLMRQYRANADQIETRTLLMQYMRGDLSRYNGYTIANIIADKMLAAAEE